MFGLREYMPYLALVVVLHLSVAALMRATMRRLGVRAWIATAAASLFALFGSGHEDIAWAFQIGFERGPFSGALGGSLAVEAIHATGKIEEFRSGQPPE